MFCCDQRRERNASKSFPDMRFLQRYLHIQDIQFLQGVFAILNIPFYDTCNFVKLVEKENSGGFLRNAQKQTMSFAQQGGIVAFDCVKPKLKCHH